MTETHVNEKASAIFKEAEQYFAQGRDNEAVALYNQIVQFQPFSPLAYYRLGEITNRHGDPESALKCHRKALEIEPALAKRLLKKEEHNYNYIFTSLDEVFEVDQCPVCNAQDTRLHSVYNCLSNADFIPGFDPIRQWQQCMSCEHIFAKDYPRNINDVLSNTAPFYHLNPKVNKYPTIGAIINDIKQHVPEMTMLEVGTGAGEFTGVACEMGFEVLGNEIRKPYADKVSKRFGIDVEVSGFMELSTNKKFGAVIMGDVLEHFTHPDRAIEKAKSLLAKEGVLWISTPNFESAYTKTLKHNDPMWKVCEHLNYFSRRTLALLLSNHGLEMVHYSVSSLYNGSMEVIVKEK